VKSRLNYGRDRHVELEFAPEADVRICAARPMAGVTDVRAATREALESPLEFPPLGRSVVPGDQITISVESGVPQAATIVAEVVEELLGVGIEPNDISVLIDAGERGPDWVDPRSEVSDEWRDKIELVVHDPLRRSELRYLAATEDKAARPIYLNHRLVDADQVVTIGCTRCQGPHEVEGVPGGIYPTFSDVETQRRFRNAEMDWHSTQSRGRAGREAERADWLLGAPFTIQVVPDSEGGISAVIAGSSEQAWSHSKELADRVWRHRVDRRARLVVAAISGGMAEQTWENLGRAVDMAAALVGEDGAIAVCCELGGDLGPGMAQLAAARESAGVLRRIERDAPVDGLPAKQVSEARDRARIFLLSGFSEETVEELGLAYVAREGEVTRLVQQFDSVIVLPDVQFCVATLDEES
jgi:nickel-dependent lactate racemase